MYFNEIYNKIRPLWKESYSLDGLDITETYVKDIKQEYNRIETLVDFSQKGKYSEWESMLVFTMYQTLTAFAIRKWNYEKVDLININDIPITVFEEYFRKNMEPEGEFEGNEEFFNKYKGLRD